MVAATNVGMPTGRVAVSVPPPGEAKTAGGMAADTARRWRSGSAASVTRRMAYHAVNARYVDCLGRLACRKRKMKGTTWTST